MALCALHVLELIIKLSELKQTKVLGEKFCFISDTGIRDVSFSSPLHVSAAICEPSSEVSEVSLLLGMVIRLTPQGQCLNKRTFHLLSR